MTEETTQAPAIPESFSSPDEAARFWTQAQVEQPAQEENSSAESAEPATAEHESADEADTAPLEEAPGETEGSDPEAEQLPPVERPRSWSKDDDADWKALPRAAQEKIAAREHARETELRRTQNDAAEKLKGLTAKEQAAEQARQAAETKAKQAYDVLLREQVRDFPDVRSMDDVTKLAQTDPLRYIQWQAHQQELQVQAAVVKEAEQRSNQEKQSKRSAYAEAQTAALREKIPDYADAAKLQAAREKALPLLSEYGLDLPTLNKWAETDAGFEILQHAGFQHLIADLLKARDTEAARQKAAKAPVTKAVPPVVRPGARQSGGQSSALQSATQTFNLNPTPQNAAKLAVARRAASSRN
ncbi:MULTISPECIES: hypothetical protein [unclassified Bradyrhizobium]|uniref:hypothetical protein n=2 Tax=Bradyrhizobium TaxID=374 RepID=UPI0028E825AE|nr:MULTISPECIES: hypothetical protein [unclassified Bradyrhizobium]